jgi:enamine deaminase RidA (YjgF/YER057c/UK114 family)
MNDDIDRLQLNIPAKGRITCLYANYFGETRPARSTAGLAHPDALVEIEAIAQRSSSLSTT